MTEIVSYFPILVLLFSDWPPFAAGYGICVPASCEWKYWKVASGSLPFKTAGRCPLPLLLRFSSSVCQEWGATILDHESRSPTLGGWEVSWAGPASLCRSEPSYQPWLLDFCQREIKLLWKPMLWAVWVCVCVWEIYQRLPLWDSQGILCSLLGLVPADV